MPPTPETDDTTGRDELAVMRTIARALDSLDTRAQRRVLAYVIDRFHPDTAGLVVAIRRPAEQDATPDGVR